MVKFIQYSQFIFNLKTRKNKFLMTVTDIYTKIYKAASCVYTQETMLFSHKYTKNMMYIINLKDPLAFLIH